MKSVPVGCYEIGLNATASGAQDLPQGVDIDSGNLRVQ